MLFSDNILLHIDSNSSSIWFLITALYFSIDAFIKPFILSGINFLYILE